MLGNAVTDDTDGFADGIDDNGNATDDADDAFTSLPNATTGSTYSLKNIPIKNTTGSVATLYAWIDFDQDGQFEVSEYQSATIANGGSVANLSWSVPNGSTAGTTYARFRLTTNSLADNGATANVDERSLGSASDGEVEDYAIAVTAPTASAPSVLLAKRITAINRGLDNEQMFDTTYVDVTDDASDNAVNWPGGAVPATIGSGTVESYIRGITGADQIAVIAGATTRPDDVLEYAIPFLSDGAVAAKNVLICDLIPVNTTFIDTAFNGTTPAAPGAGNRGIFLSFNGNEVALTNASDGDEIADTGNSDGIGGYYFPAGVEPSSTFPGLNCGGANDNGAIVVDLSDIPNATGEGTPANAYGFIRFRAVVD